MSDIQKTKRIVEKLSEAATGENIQKYVLGTKKSGEPRALYDIVKDYVEYKRKNRKNKKKSTPNSYAFYLKAKKKKKKKDKHWKF